VVRNYFKGYDRIGLSDYIVLLMYLQQITPKVENMPAPILKYLLALVASIVLTASAAASGSHGAPTYEVYAVRFATVPGFPVQYLVQGAAANRKIDIAMTFWVLKGGGKVVLFDSGFYRDKFFKSWTVKDFVRPSEAISELNIKPEQVTDVVISHIHWDHADGADLFPKAHVWIQRDEYMHYIGDAWQGGRGGEGADVDDVLALVKINEAGRLNLINGDDLEILPGVRSYIGGKHTFQSQYLGVQTRQGTVVLASDNVYLFENLEKHAPIAQTLDAKSNLKAQDRMRTLAATPALIIPGHDPKVFVQFPKITPRVVRID